MVALTMTVRGVVEQEFAMPKTTSHDSVAKNAASHRTNFAGKILVRRTPAPLAFGQRFVNAFDHPCVLHKSTVILRMPRRHKRGMDCRTSGRGRQKRKLQTEFFGKESFT
jgi:hypothetical protein